MYFKKHLSLLFATATLILASGCAPKNPLPMDNNYTSYHINVPFVNPRSDLCGATSIEMVSSYWQATTAYVPRLTSKELDERTLIPDKGGTLQIELAATARADGLLVYPLEPTFDALFTELKQHHPVIVLVNRSFSWHPLWHYVPITGYDAKEQTILMHFYDKPNEAVPIGTFAALWKRSNNWGVVLLPPDQLPASASPQKFLQSAYDLEKTGMIDDAITAYKSALVRWPKDIHILFALGNTYYNVHRLNDAEQTYKKILSIDPTDPLTLNNLADLLCHTNRSEEALKALNQAVTNDPKIESIIDATRKDISTCKAQL